MLKLSKEKRLRRKFINGWGMKSVKTMALE